MIKRSGKLRRRNDFVLVEVILQRRSIYGGDKWAVNLKQCPNVLAKIDKFGREIDIEVFNFRRGNNN